LLLLRSDDAWKYFPYLSLGSIVTLEDDGGLAITADVSGRHYERDAEVIAVLRLLRAELGGIIRDDFDGDIV